jgi:hypothetical protein
MLPLLLAVGAVVGVAVAESRRKPTTVVTAPPPPQGFGLAALKTPSHDLVSSFSGKLGQLPGIGPAAAAAVGLGAASATLVAKTGGNTATQVAAFLNPAGLIGHATGTGARAVVNALGAPKAVGDAAYRGAAAAGTVEGWATMTAGPFGTVLAAPLAASVGGVVAVAPFAVSGAKSAVNALSAGATEAKSLAASAVHTAATDAKKAASSVEHAVSRVLSHIPTPW